uniref:Uncharacterized protein n=1 Tax=Anguilla anguilla TaxID=7936 RepID=A0A0E9VQF7_ANGAN
MYHALLAFRKAGCYSHYSITAVRLALQP